MIISNEQKINWSSLYLKNAKNYFICQFITNAYFEFIAMNPIKEKSSEKYWWFRNINKTSCQIISQENALRTSTVRLDCNTCNSRIVSSQ